MKRLYKGTPFEKKIPKYRTETYTDYSANASTSRTQYDNSYKNTEKTTLSVDRPPTRRLAGSIAMYIIATVELSQNSKYGEHRELVLQLKMEAYKGFSQGLSMEGIFDKAIAPIEDELGEYG